MDAAANEWCFEFDVVASEPIGYAAMEERMLSGAVAWAEANDLGVGGGFRPAPPASPGDQQSSAWRFRFGLCVACDGAPLPENQARELRDLLARWCADRGLRFVGGYRRFTAEDLE